MTRGNMGNQHNGKKKDKKYFGFFTEILTCFFIKQSTLEAISKLTKFTPDEIREWRLGVLKDCPNGQLTEV